MKTKRGKITIQYTHDHDAGRPLPKSSLAPPVISFARDAFEHLDSNRGDHGAIGDPMPNSFHFNF